MPHSFMGVLMNTQVQHSRIFGRKKRLGFFFKISGKVVKIPWEILQYKLILTLPLKIPLGVQKSTYRKTANNEIRGHCPFHSSN